MGGEKKFNELLQIRQRGASVNASCIIYSDSEYGLLVPIQITYSYLLNVTSNENVASRSSIWVEEGEAI